MYLSGRYIRRMNTQYFEKKNLSTCSFKEMFRSQQLAVYFHWTQQDRLVFFSHIQKQRAHKIYYSLLLLKHYIVCQRHILYVFRTSTNIKTEIKISSLINIQIRHIKFCTRDDERSGTLLDHQCMI